MYNTLQNPLSRYSIDKHLMAMHTYPQEGQLGGAKFYQHLTHPLQEHILSLVHTLRGSLPAGDQGKQ